MQVMMSIVRLDINCSCSVVASELLKPTRAEDTPPMVTAMPTQDKNVRSRAALHRHHRQAISNQPGL